MDTTAVTDLMGMDHLAAAAMVLRADLRVDMYLSHPDLVAVCLHLTDLAVPVTLGPQAPQHWQILLRPPRFSL